MTSKPNDAALKPSERFRALLQGRTYDSAKEEAFRTLQLQILDELHERRLALDEQHAAGQGEYPPAAPTHCRHGVSVFDRCVYCVADSSNDTAGSPVSRVEGAAEANPEWLPGVGDKVLVRNGAGFPAEITELRITEPPEFCEYRINFGTVWYSRSELAPVAEPTSLVARQEECPHGVGLCTATCPSKKVAPSPVAVEPMRCRDCGRADCPMLRRGDAGPALTDCHDAQHEQQVEALESQLTAAQSALEQANARVVEVEAERDQAHGRRAIAEQESSHQHDLYLRYRAQAEGYEASLLATRSALTEANARADETIRNLERNVVSEFQRAEGLVLQLQKSRDEKRRIAKGQLTAYDQLLGSWFCMVCCKGLSSAERCGCWESPAAAADEHIATVAAPPVPTL